MMVNTVLFDLDGTLLPMDEDVFTKAYFKELCQALAPIGVAPETLIGAVWAGTKAMVANDGTVCNAERFWARFAEMVPGDAGAARAMCDAFYAREFDRVKRVLHPAPYAKEAVLVLKKKGYTVALATNPIFPMVAVETRLRWIDLRITDFDLITSYENSRFCKPNPAYYKEILAQLGRVPGECMMVGNNALEDMCFAELGGRVFLVTDHLENPKGQDTAGIPQGSFAELSARLKEMPAR